MTVRRRQHRHRARPRKQAFLDDHRIDGTPVLPGVMGMEGFAEAAAALLPGWHVSAVEDVDYCAPFKFYRDQRARSVRALLRDDGEGSVVADCALIGAASCPARARRTVTSPAVSGSRPSRPAPRRRTPRRTAADDARTTRGRLSRLLPRPRLPGARSRLARERRRSSAASRGPPPTTSRPTSRSNAAPRLIELCFQTAGVYELGTAGRMALPTHVDRHDLRRRGLAGPPLRGGPRARTRPASTPRSSTTTAGCACASRATAVKVPGGVDESAGALARGVS